MIPKQTKEIKIPQIERELPQKIILKAIDWGTENIEEFEKSQKEIKQMVKNVLEISEEARGNDLILFFECIRLQFPNIIVENDKDNIKIKIPRNLISSLNPPESYRRWRQKYNENNEYLPTSNVILRRRNKEKAYRKFFGGKKDDKMD